ncbi:hypothetical protein ACIRBX_05155 [Kitasatospora sp. NPDC096147]|uniref:hypothetical protein n=1 Tax=Kitasatospora sp. NPDC096147 TaxID=3364093 RepID=UPI00380653FE
MHFDQDEPQEVRDRRLAGELEARRAARAEAPLDLTGAHVGAALVAVGVALLGWFGQGVAVGVVVGVFVLWFGAALTWVRWDGGRGWHGLGRAYGLTFGWGDGV